MKSSLAERNKPNSRFRHVYAIVRIDLPIGQANPENNISVVKVFSSETAAERESSRLSRINSEKGCRYVVQITRMMPSME
jgi:hypothetical protein